MSPAKQKQRPTLRNTDVAQVFEEIADLLEIQGDNPFRIRAYRNAANLVAGLGIALADMLANGDDLTELPGIGKDLAAKIHEIAQTSTCAALEKLRKKLPPTLPALLKLPGLGPKRVQTLYQRLDIGTPDQLYQAVHEGKVRELPGFGEKIEKVILQALEKPAGTGARFKLVVAAHYAERLKAYLSKIAGVTQVVISGSYRRCRETVGDLDIVVTAKRGSPVMNRFCKHKDVAQVVSKGGTRVTVKLASGLQVDLRLVPQRSFGAALHYFTGSKGHNIMIRRLGQQKRLKINEYGVFRGDQRIGGNTEESIFAAVGLPYIPPELRENRGEIEAARAGRLPTLVERVDVKGDLHVPAPVNGKLAELVVAAREQGLHYLAITMSPRHVDEQLAAIARVRASVRGISLLTAIEANILENGELDLPDPMPADVDLVVGAVADDFGLTRTRQTERILRALDHPRLTILAPPVTDAGPRPRYDVDMARIIRKACERRCFLELNVHPDRLDLLDVDCQMARDQGVLIAISAGARRAEDFANLAFAVGQARRGWLEAKNVLNTRAFEELSALIKRG